MNRIQVAEWIRIEWRNETESGGAFNRIWVADWTGIRRYFVFFLLFVFMITTLPIVAISKSAIADQAAIPSGSITASVSSDYPEQDAIPEKDLADTLADPNRQIEPEWGAAGTHTYLAVQALTVLNKQGITIPQQMEIYQPYISWGAFQEDYPLDSYIGDILHDSLFASNHGFDPDAGPFSGAWLDPVENNAWVHAAWWFQNALNYYQGNGVPRDVKASYYALGRAAHLLADATVPAHAHRHIHLSDHDALEWWLDDWEGGRYKSQTWTDTIYLSKVAGLTDFPTSSIVPSGYYPNEMSTINGYGDWRPTLFYLFFEVAQRAQTFRSEHAKYNFPNPVAPANYTWAAGINFANWNSDPPGTLSHFDESQVGDIGYSQEEDENCKQQASCLLPTALKGTALLYRLFIEQIPSIQVISPNGGQTWPVGSSQIVSWTATNVIGNVKIELSRDSGASYSEILATSVPANQGTWIWGNVSEPLSSKCRIRFITLDDMQLQSQSSHDFEIVEPSEYKWERISPFPSAGEGPSLAYAENTGEVILFGRNNSPNDTWAYNPASSKWTNKNPTNPPSARNGASLVYAANTGQVILFGGNASNATNDTWAYDSAANSWTNKNPANPPPARGWHSMVYMENVGKVLLFGGLSGQRLNDTWVYDPLANTWTQLYPTNSPSGRYMFGMTYATNAGKVILFGGVTYSSEVGGDTWVYDPMANTWEAKNPANSPPARYTLRMVNMETTGYVVLFGGLNANWTAWYDDTWYYDVEKNNWILQNTTNHPPARLLFDLTYITDTGQAVLFGGTDVSMHNIHDTWTYDSQGNNWTDRSACAPPNRSWASMSYAKNTDQVVLFGGSNGLSRLNNQLYDDTWSYDPASRIWVTCNPTNHPSSRQDHAMVYAETTGQIVLFGGYDTSGGLNDTWVYDPKTNTWLDKNPTNAPPARYAHAMAYAANTGKVVLFGGVGSTGNLSDTWVYDPVQNTWQCCDTVNSPSPRSGHEMAYAANTGKVILFGGDTNYGGLNETWTYDPVANDWTNRYPANSPPGRSDATLAYVEDIGKIVSYGGFNTTDTWLYDPVLNDWSNINPLTPPGWSWSPMIAFAPSTGQLILHCAWDETWGLQLSSEKARNPPIFVNLPSSETIETTQPLLFFVDAYDPGGDALSFGIEPGAPPGLTIDGTSGFLSWSAPIEGIHLVNISADDGHGHRSTATLTIRVTSTQMTLSGRVYDSASESIFPDPFIPTQFRGGVGLPSAFVRLVDQDTGQTRETTTNTAGEFFNLIAETNHQYKLEVWWRTATDTSSSSLRCIGKEDEDWGFITRSFQVGANSGQWLEWHGNDGLLNLDLRTKTEAIEGIGYFGEHASPAWGKPDMDKEGLLARLQNSIAIYRNLIWAKWVAEGPQYLNHPLNYQVTVRFGVGVNEKSTDTWYSDPTVQGENLIQISDAVSEGSSYSDMIFESRRQPDNVEWHEFSHHLQKELFWPELVLNPNGEDMGHWGFATPDTSWNLIEGFAEFSSCYIAKILQVSAPEKYSAVTKESFLDKSIERNYKPWDYFAIRQVNPFIPVGQFQTEEFAVAGLLWDLFDQRNETAWTPYLRWDTVNFPRDYLTVPASEIFSTFADSRPATVWNLYQALSAKGVGAAVHQGLSELDQVFLMHGIFKDANGNWAYDGPGSNDTIGMAANGAGLWCEIPPSGNTWPQVPRSLWIDARLERTNSPIDPRSMIYIGWIGAQDVTTTDGLLHVSMSFDPPNQDDSFQEDLLVADGLLPIGAPPSSDAWTMTCSDDFGHSYTLTSTDYWTWMENPTGEAIAELAFTTVVPPLAPSALRLVSSTSTAIEIAWYPGQNESYPVAQQSLFRQTRTETTPILLATLSPSANYYLDETVSPSVSYSYWLVAEDDQAPANQSEPSETLLATALPPWGLNILSLSVSPLSSITCSDLVQVEAYASRPSLWSHNLSRVLEDGSRIAADSFSVLTPTAATPSLLFTWSPSIVLQPGDYVLTAQAVDPSTGESSPSWEQPLFIVGINQSPSWLNLPHSATATVGIPFSYSMTATDLEGDPLEYYLLSGQEGVTLSTTTGEVSWVPTETGTHSIIVGVSDDWHSIQNSTLTVIVQPGFTDLGIRFALQGAAGLKERTFTARFFDAGMTTDPLHTYTMTVATTATSLQMLQIPPGTFDIQFKAAQALSTRVTGIRLQGRASTIELGEQRVGDANDDDVINIMDFAILKGAIFTWEGQPGFDPRADFSGDGVVNIMDFALMKSNFGRYGPL